MKISPLQDYKSPKTQNASEYSLSSDVFSLGLIFYYALSNGLHPFQNVINNSIKGKVKNKKFGNISFSSNHLENMHDQYKSYFAEDLIKCMISEMGAQRTSAKNILISPLFWDTSEVLDYIIETHKNWNK